MTPIPPDIARLPKAELHVHLEGTAGPALVRDLAARHGVAVPDGLVTADGEGFAWSDFLSFLAAYDLASNVIRTADDYRRVTAEYLIGIAGEGAIYAELMSSPDHAALAGLDYVGHLDGIAAGIEEARAATGIEARIIVTCVRHFGVDRAMAVAEQVVRHPHPLVTGFGMGGDEAGFPPAQFAPVFRKAVEEAGLAAHVHAGEFDGPARIREALDTLPVTRLGHGVRSVEDPALVERLVADGIVLEVCPTSNVATGVAHEAARHPLRPLFDAGVKVTLNSDDPPYFHTSLGREYALAASAMGFGLEDLRGMTRTALEAAFVDETTRAALLAKL